MINNKEKVSVELLQKEWEDRFSQLVMRLEQLEESMQRLQVGVAKPTEQSANKGRKESYTEPLSLVFSEEETSQHPGLIHALNVTQYRLTFQGEDPFVSHFFYIKEKFKCFLKNLREKMVIDWEDEIEKFASELLNAVDLFDDYFWGYSLETCRELSSKIPDLLQDDARKIRAALMEFLKAGKIEELYYPFGSPMDSEQQYFILPEAHLGKQEMKIDTTLRPGFIKLNPHGDCLNLRKSIVRIL